MYYRRYTNEENHNNTEPINTFVSLLCAKTEYYQCILLFFVTLEQSRVLSGLSPPLQISHRVVPKPHLSVAKLRFWGFLMHSGGTHGIRSTRTDRDTEAQREGDT